MTMGKDWFRPGSRYLICVREQKKSMTRRFAMWKYNMYEIGIIQYVWKKESYLFARRDVLDYVNSMKFKCV